MDAHCKRILKEYTDNIAAFEQMQLVVLDIVNNLLKENGIITAVVDSRVKKADSLKLKLERKGYKYHGMPDITDLLGLRIVSFYSEEVDKISSLLEREFEIDWENSVDKSKLLESDRFGYKSVHYICKFPKDVIEQEQFAAIKDCKFEIQIRTVLQHAWATVYHDIGYKSDVEIPKRYIRSLSRLAGLLEIADEQFSKINIEIIEYRRKVKSLVKDGKFEDLELNLDTFNSYIELKPFAQLSNQIASINKAEIAQQSMGVYLEVFKFLGFKTIGDIEKFKNDYSIDAYRLAGLQISGTDLDILAETIGVQNLCIVYLIKTGKGVEGIKGFLDILYGEKPRNQNSAQRFFSQASSIGIVSHE